MGPQCLSAQHPGTKSFNNPAGSLHLECWIVKCQSKVVANDQLPTQRCKMIQEQFQSGSGQRVLAVSVQSNKTIATITLLTPLGLKLVAGIENCSLRPTRTSRDPNFARCGHWFLHMQLNVDGGPKRSLKDCGSTNSIFHVSASQTGWPSARRTC
ncbi:hypothetical protein GO984_21665 [Rhodobacteraceae bacterium CY05]|uniref:Uncharacterized protein n=1 Tax=Parasedimentitalea huanghaiensis TaxID=2682100 RepID=A0A6L6WKS7_9RHOB|nr:hypothetical protein [Zongyanglinia huanghaiensis]